MSPPRFCACCGFLAVPDERDGPAWRRGHAAYCVPHVPAVTHDSPPRSTLRYLSVCSGIEAATVAWHPLGWEPAAFAEIDAFPSAVLAHRFPDVPNLGDFTKIGTEAVGKVDLLVGGTPCQDFSVAGLRAGMAGERGSLTLEFCRLLDRIRPRWVVWENVPGILSSDGGRAFGAFLGALEELGYGWAYRVLDAQFFGVPQRRRRVFVVGCLGDERRAAAVLFERASVSGHPAPRRETGAIAPALTRDGLGGGGPDDNLAQGNHLVAHALRAEGFDASEDGTGCGTPLVPVAFDTTQITSATNYSNPKPGDPRHPLAARAHPPAIAFSCKDHGADAGELAPTLRAMGHSGSHANAGGQVAVVGALSAVRRLTPLEAERLQGFPDDFTLVPYRGKPAADGNRYRALGNSMAVPVMHWIGERIALVDVIADVESEGAA